MKNKLFSILAALMLAVGVNAQEVFNEGDTQLNFGLGFGALYLDAYSIGLIPAVNFSGEYGSIPTGEIGLVSFGGIAEFHYAPYYQYYGTLWTEETRGDDFNFAIQARGAWHLHVFNSTKWDLYAGFGTGFRIGSWSRTVYYTDGSTNKSSGSYSDFLISEFVGGRLMTSENFGFFAELGYGGLSSMRIGLTIKL